MSGIFTKVLQGSLFFAAGAGAAEGTRFVSERKQRHHIQYEKNKISIIQCFNRSKNTEELNRLKKEQDDWDDMNPIMKMYYAPPDPTRSIWEPNTNGKQ